MEVVSPQEVPKQSSGPAFERALTRGPLSSLSCSLGGSQVPGMRAGEGVGRQPQGTLGTLASVLPHKSFIKLMNYKGAVKKPGASEVSGRSLLTGSIMQHLFWLKSKWTV